MKSWKQPMLPVRRGRWISAPVTVAAATVIGALIGPLAPAAWAAGTAPPATIQHAGTARSASPRSASVTGPGGVGVRLLDVPADAVNNPRARAYIVDNLTPGTTIHRRMVVSNTTKSELHVAVYPDAATISRGSFAGAPGHTVNDLSSWTTVSRPTLDIPAGSTAVDTVTVAIPSAASPGERYAVVWAEVRGAKNGGSIELVSRAGIRMYVSVGGTNPVTSFTMNTMTGQRNSGGHPVVRALVHNTGGRAVDLAGTLTMSSVTGALTAGPYPAQLGTTLAPGQSEPVSFVLTSQMADGPWNATVTLGSGLNKQAFRAQITFPRAGTAPVPAARPASGGFGIVPVLAGAIFIVLLAALGALIISHRRRRNHGNRSGAHQTL
jgi:hypothetical protein